jgi:peptide/nickel transport system permease protein
MQVGWMLGYTVLVENIFGRGGIGSYAVTSVLQADLLAVVAVVLIIGFVFVFMNFLVDLAQMALNPRLRQVATA